MVSDFLQDKYIMGLRSPLEISQQAASLGRKMVQEGVNRVFFVACGAPNKEMASIKYWMDIYSKTIESYLYYPAEFVCQSPAMLDQNSLVIMMSHSGKTPEIVEAAKFIKSFPCKTLSVTMAANSPLAEETENNFCYGQSKASFEAKFVILLAMVSAMMQEKGDWDLHEEIMTGLQAFPNLLAEAEEQSAAKNQEYANRFKNEDFYMTLGSGPCYTTAYGFGVCVMMESLWLKLFVGEAAEFFHGPFEIVDKDIPAIVYLGEDPSRPIGERVVRFLKNHTEKLMIYDSKDFDMSTIPNSVRAILAPYIIGAASNSFVDHLAVWRDHPLSTRRYMGKMDY